MPGPPKSGLPPAAPSPQEIQALVNLFSKGLFAELATLAQQITQRFPRHPLGWKALGIALKQTGRAADALGPMRQAASLAPKDAEIHNNLGVTLRDLGQLEEARESLRRAVKIKPDYAEAHANLGITLRDLGQLKEAEASCRRALAINAGQIDALSNLGTILRDSGRPDEAEKTFRQALRQQPTAHEVHHNLGMLMASLGRLDEAEAGFVEALRIQPEFVEALNSYAGLCLARNDPITGLNAIIQSLQIRATPEAKRLFVDCVKPLRFSDDNPDIRQILVAALQEPWGRPADLAGVCTSLIKAGPGLGDHALPAPEPLLCALLAATQINDIELEHILTKTRHALLERVQPQGDKTAECIGDLGLVGALACQCFINEYVFAITADEARRVEMLCARLRSAWQSGQTIAAAELLVLASYLPLHTLPDATRLLERPWPAEAEAVLTQQVREPMLEAEGRETVPRLTEIDDLVSCQVRQQYEDNPYPRWVRTAPAGQAHNAVVALREKYPLARFCPQPNPGIDILIAGCGTGQHSIETAQRARDARVLAIDLSLSSLAYARRKSHETGLDAIEYAQADILRLGSLDRRFDIIESGGVLHHLADPWAGWKTLLSLLRPGGLMRIGLYSRSARRHIARIRERFGKGDAPSSPDGIRRCRQELIALGSSEDFGNTLQMTDFFSTSACRDLLFHVQEHCLTLPEITAFLGEQQLVFIGFDLDAQVMQAYRQRFPDDPAATDLVRWHRFESENPDTFLAMYQFWVQKP